MGTHSENTHRAPVSVSVLESGGRSTVVELGQGWLGEGQRQVSWSRSVSGYTDAALLSSPRRMVGVGGAAFPRGSAGTGEAPEVCQLIPDCEGGAGRES